jgi:thiol-disulfide isomerase/thioredoxin
MKINYRLSSFAAVALLAVISSAQSAKPSADALLASIKAVPMPKYDPARRSEDGYVKKYIADLTSANAERNKLILEFYQDYPDNDETPALLEQRWQTLLRGGQIDKAAYDAAILETAQVAAADVPKKLKVAAEYWESNYKLQEADGSPSKVLAAIDDFTRVFPTEDRGAELLTMASYSTHDTPTLLTINKRILKDYPASKYAKYAFGIVHRIEAVGKPFDLSFADAISGKQISIADLKGKVVLVDFWATWCGPCVGEMPHVKDLYSQYHSKGLEIVGVSLDQPLDKGGLTKLKAFVAKNDIPWAQYYQGNYWDSAFSTSWGINSIPCLFIVDKKGNLLDVDGRTDLDKKVADLLKE